MRAGERAGNLGTANAHLAMKDVADDSASCCGCALPGLAADHVQSYAKEPANLLDDSFIVHSLLSFELFL